MDYFQEEFVHGFKFLDPQTNIKTNQKYHLICPKGHNIFVRLTMILQRLDRVSKGCIHCHREELDKQSLDVSHKHLPEGFKILTTYRKEVVRKVVRTIKKYQVQCPKGDLFMVDSGRFKDLTCPKCTEQILIGQERTLEIFKQIFNAPFKSIRPDWLKNPKTNKNLELDGYNKDLNIAIEFQGRQHTSSNTQFGDGYEAQVKRDELKKELCKKLGVKLIEIHQPPQYKEKKFIQSVVDQIKQQINLDDYPNINLDKGNINFDGLKLDGLKTNVKDFLEYLQNESPIKGYSCITTDFHTKEDNITMCCPKGHNFGTTAAEFRRNAQGIKGRSIPCKQCWKLECEPNALIDLAYCAAEGIKHGLTLISTVYKNVNEELEWKDANGEIIQLAFRKLQRRKLIKKSNNKGIDLEFCREKGKEFGLELLSTEYKNVNEPLQWKDSNGEIVELYLRQLQRSKKNDPKPKTGITLEFCRAEGAKYGLTLLSTEYKNVNQELEWQKDNGDILKLKLRQIQRSKTGIF